MNKEQWQSEWRELKRKVEEEPCPGVLGMDLIHGQLFKGVNFMQSFPLQVFGKKDFLRNVMQRVLEWDIGQKAPIIILAPAEETELPELVFKVFLDEMPWKPGSFFQYATCQVPHVPPLFKSADFFDSGESKFVYVKLGLEGLSRALRLLFAFESEIKALADNKYSSSSKNGRPAIYIFQPELLEADYHISEYARGLKKNAELRVFSKELQIFNWNETSLIYGPELYPKKTYENMRWHCYYRLWKNRKWDKKNGFWGDREDPAVLKAAKVASEGIPIVQTAFARFKIEQSRGDEYFWFYPVRKDLGRESYCLLSEENESLNKNSRIDAIKADPLAKVFNDLKPGQN